MRITPPYARAAAFGAGLAALLSALLLNSLGVRIISAHMVQHLLLTVIAPPLIVWSRAGLFAWAALPLAWRRHGHSLRTVARPAWHPIIAWLLFCGSFVVWHIPGVYERMTASSALHLFALLTFFISALAFWACVMDRARSRGSAILLVMTAAMASSLPGALMTFAPRTLYRGLPDPLPVCGLTALQDQQLAGLLMWIPMDAVMFAVAGWLFFSWLQEAERSVSPAMRAAASLSVLFLALLLAGCGEQNAQAEVSAIGDAKRGAALATQYGCNGCHVIPGITGVQGYVGPPLTSMNRRVYIAGMLRNSPDNMVRWLENPQAIVPGNAMPNMNISRNDARDLTAFLATLR